jgi:hypothetical protein
MQILRGLVAEICRDRGGRKDFGNQDRRLGGQILPLTADRIDDRIGIANGARIDVHGKVRCPHRPAPCVKTAFKRIRQPARDESMTARSAGHHDDAALRQLISPFAALDPGEERVALHWEWSENIHWRLMPSFYRPTTHEKRPGISPGPP